MRKFDTVKQLWDFCLYCPICKEPSRTITVTVGPDDDFRLDLAQKSASELKLHCGFRHLTDARRGKPLSYVAIYTIDCDNNSFEISVSGTDQSIVEKIKKSYFFCYLHGKCHGCDRTYLNSSDLEFDTETRTISNIRMDQEAVYLIYEEDRFHISLSHSRNVMMVSRFEDMGDARIDDHRIIELPMINHLEFSNAPKVINKIKTLILFS